MDMVTCGPDEYVKSTSETHFFSVDVKEVIQMMLSTMLNNLDSLLELAALTRNLDDLHFP